MEFILEIYGNINLWKHLIVYFHLRKSHVSQHPKTAMKYILWAAAEQLDYASYYHL